jgi:hypothetical protein
MSRCYHHKCKQCHQLHCASHCSRTDCRFQRPSRLPFGGGGCRTPKQKFKWKTTGSTRRKLRRCYRHVKTSSVFGTINSISSSNSTLNVFRQACIITKELSFFDAFDGLDDILFEDALTELDVFYSCFDCLNDISFSIDIKKHAHRHIMMRY